MEKDPNVVRQFESWAAHEAKKKKRERIVGNIALSVIACVLIFVGFVLSEIFRDGVFDVL